MVRPDITRKRIIEKKAEPEKAIETPKPTTEKAIEKPIEKIVEKQDEGVKSRIKKFLGELNVI